MLESINYTLIPDADIPEPLKKALSPDAPAPMRMMAAKGLLPVPPTMTLCAWYQLSIMADDNIKSMIRDTVRGFDANILKDLASSDIPAQQLDWLAKMADTPAITEAVILNNATADATIMDLAAIVPRDLADLIAENHVRLLRAPDIIEKLYLNPATRMATIDRVLALAKENNVEVNGLKALQDALKTNELARDTTPGLDDEEFEAVITQAAADAAKEKEPELALHDIKSIEEEQEAEPEEKKERRMSRMQLIEKMNAPQRIRLALLGTREDRNILLRDTRRVVYMSVIQSPKMSIGEVGSIAASKNMPDDVIAYVAKRRDWIRSYPIVVALVNNPKCPFGDALAFLKQLRLNDLKFLQRSKSISATLARQAQTLYKQKQQSTGSKT